MYRGKVHRAGADAEAGHLDKGDHGTAQQRHAENAKQQQPRHDRLRCAFFAYPRKKLRQVEEQCAHHPHREQDAVHPRPPLHNGKDRLLPWVVVGRILASLCGAVEAAVQVAGPGGKVLLGADRAQCLIGRTAAQPCHMAEAVPCLGKGRGDIFRLDGLAGRGALASAAGQGARVTGGVDFVCHSLPITGRCLGVGINALKLRGAADGPVKAARAVIVQTRVAEVVLQLVVLLQPVGQRLQLRHSRIDFCARVGGHR